MTVRLLLLASLVTLLGCRPLGPIPGGTLGGAIAPPPADWTQLDEVEVIQLESRPGDPYSVNLWGVGLPAGYYVGGSEGSSWVENMSADPNVRLRIGDGIYELHAVRVEDAAELERVAAHYQAKYDTDPESDDWRAAWFFRLDPR